LILPHKISLAVIQATIKLQKGMQSLRPSHLLLLLEMTNEMVWFVKKFNLGIWWNTLIQSSSIFQQYLWCM